MIPDDCPLRGFQPCVDADDPPPPSAARSGKRKPLVLRFTSGENIPEPGHTLLVHNQDMTPTLENYWKTPLRIEVIRRMQFLGADQKFMREVILHAGNPERPVEYGVITIHISLFPEAAQLDIRNCQKPLGGILREHGIVHSGGPKAYFMAKINKEVAAALRMKKVPDEELCGRWNVLRDSAGNVLADSVEIIPGV